MENGNDVLKAVYGSADKPLRIGDLEIPCYVLEDGRRVLHQGSMVKSLGMSYGSSGGTRGDRLAKFITGKSLEPFVSKDLADLTGKPISFRTPRGSLAYGYEATILADICEAVLAARKAGALQKQQSHIADKCEILVRGFARVGIIALVDEATGYQEARDKNELHRILAAYISESLMPWTKRFPDEFYKEIFRLMGWRYSPLSAKRPGVVGKITNKLIYEMLPPGVLDELRDKNPSNIRGHRKYKHHQFLTEDIGNPHLEKHLASVITLMRASSSWAGFERLFNRAFPGKEQQLDIAEFDDADDVK